MAISTVCKQVFNLSMLAHCRFSSWPTSSLRSQVFICPDFPLSYPLWTFCKVFSPHPLCATYSQNSREEKNAQKYERINLPSPHNHRPVACLAFFRFSEHHWRLETCLFLFQGQNLTPETESDGSSGEEDVPPPPPPPVGVADGDGDGDEEGESSQNPILDWWR